MLLVNNSIKSFNKIILLIKSTHIYVVTDKEQLGCQYGMVLSNNNKKYIPYHRTWR